MDRQILNFTANEQMLTVDNPIRISTNKVNYIEAHFALGDNWSGYDSVRAVWFNDYQTISTVLDSQGVCRVPFEVMKRKGQVKVDLVGSISEGDVLTDRLTSYPVVAVIVDCVAPITGAETSPITPSQFEQYVAIVQALVGSVRDIDRIELNPDYTLTIYYSDGTSDTTSSIRGATGNGIASIAKTGSSGTNPVVDTYTVTYTDGNTFAFTVTNGKKGDTGATGATGPTGNGIQSIYKTGTSGLVDTYTILYTNGNTTTFEVTNGQNGSLASTVLASTYSSSKTYAVGDYVYYSGNLYRCTTAITTAEAWTSGHWTQVALADDVSDLKSDIDAKYDIVKTTQGLSKNYIEGYYVARDGTIVADDDCCVSEVIPLAIMQPRSCTFYYGETNGTKINFVIYDKDMNFLDYWGGSNGVAMRSVANIPNTAVYARFSFKRGYSGKLTSVYGFPYWQMRDVSVVETASVGYPIVVKSNVNDGALGITPAYLEKSSVKNPSIVFYGKINAFGSVKIGHGQSETYTEYIKIDNTNLTFYVGTGAGSSIAHGLTIDTYLSVIINIKSNCDYEIIINTLNGTYTRTMTYPNSWIGNKGSIFLQAESANTFSSFEFTFNAPYEKSKWLFGDSYVSNYSDARWPYYMQHWGYDNSLINGYPGEDSKEAYIDFTSLLKHGTPKYVIWCLGMNDADSGAVNADWLAVVQNVIADCTRRGIEPILATIPNVPNIDHTYKNAWVKASGYRYIDFAEAVGASSADSTWYSGCLETNSPRIHPTPDGARLLACRAISDFPEFMQK